MSETIKEETAEAVQAEPQGLTLEKFEEATEVVSKVISETKLVYSEYFSNLTGNKVYLKPENMQYTGAYKVRGAFYKISTLSDEEKQRGLITASAGNHAQGVAYAAKLAGCKATVVMPTTTPLMKVNRTRSYGAEVVLHGDVFDEALAYANELAAEHGYTFIHPFNDLDVATGQGTIADHRHNGMPLSQKISCLRQTESCGNRSGAVPCIKAVTVAFLPLRKTAHTTEFTKCLKAFSSSCQYLMCV